MNRRDLLKSLGVSVVVPHSTTIPQQQPEQDDEASKDRYLTAVLDQHIDDTGRLLKSFEVRHGDQIRIEWVMETVDGDTLFRTEYPLHQLTEEYHERSIVLTYYTEPPDRAVRGRTYVGLDEDYVYHKHLDTQDVVTYRENIHTDTYERVV
jgi:hypothetical protein